MINLQPIIWTWPPRTCGYFTPKTLKITATCVTIIFNWRLSAIAEWDPVNHLGQLQRPVFAFSWCDRSCPHGKYIDLKVIRGIHNQSFMILTGIKCFPLRQRIRHVCFFYEAGDEILGRQLLSLEDRDMRFEVSIFNDFEREWRPEPDKSQVSKTKPRRIGYTVRCATRTRPSPSAIG